MDERKEVIETVMGIFHDLCKNYQLRLEPYRLANQQEVISVYDVTTNKRYVFASETEPMTPTKSETNKSTS